MISCQNCGNLNTPESKFCRFCGTKFLVPQPQAAPPTPYDFTAPKPYAWKTDEFSTQSEARRTIGDLSRGNQAGSGYQPQHLANVGNQHLSQPYRCPHCMSQYLPRIERRISTGGWITFAVLLVTFFPLFWIGLLIKEDVRVCPSCNSKVG